MFLNRIFRGGGGKKLVQLWQQQERAMGSGWSGFEATKLHLREPVPGDLEIAQNGKLKTLRQLAREIGVPEESLEYHGEHVAKVKPEVLRALNSENAANKGKYVIVTGISPTKEGEGKTTTTLGIAQAFTSHLNTPAFACIRQASQALTFGIKGGCAGGGYSQVIPMEKLNLHLTGDFHAISAAHNLLAAAITSRLVHERCSTDEQLLNRMCPVDKATGKPRIPVHMKRRMAKLGISEDADVYALSPELTKRLVRLDVLPSQIFWARVVDCNDKMLRNVVTTSDGVSINTSFEITAASEIMAILAQCSDLSDLRQRLSRIVVALDAAGQPLTPDDFGVVGAMTVLLMDTLAPTLIQTLEGGPAFVHAGPFASIAHGCSSSIADRLALQLVGPNGFVLTEAGFGSDLGFEKFANIKCRASGLIPDVAVITTTVKGVRAHSTLPTSAESSEHLKDGMKNLQAHIRNVKNFGLPVVISLNQFASDRSSDLEAIKKASINDFGADDAVAATYWAQGGAGAVDLAKAVARASQSPSKFRFLYAIETTTIEERIRIIAQQVYGARDIALSDKAKEKIKQISDLGFDRSPICMAKTPSSFSHDPKLKGAPSGFVLPISDIRAFVGAGHIVAYVGDIMLMPALPTRPSFFEIDIDSCGRIIGLA